MNPNNPTADGQNLMQDIRLPGQAQAPRAVVPTPTQAPPAVTQPVLSPAAVQPTTPSAAQPASNPITHAFEPPVIPAANDDQEMDQILKDVNHEINAPPPNPANQSKIHVPKVKVKKPSHQAIIAESKKFAPLAIAFSVGLVLAISAFYAFRHSSKPLSTAYVPGKVGTSSLSSDAIESAGGTLITPADLDNFSNSLQTKLNNLNDSQDFNSGDLSDQALGL